MLYDRSKFVRVFRGQGLVLGIWINCREQKVKDFTNNLEVLMIKVYL